MKTWLTATVLAVAAAILVVGLLVLSCGGAKRGLSLLPINGPDGSALSEGFDAGLDLVMTRDVSGAPSGVKVYWWRVNVPNITGYYIYRDVRPITEADPALRVNGGNQVPQPPESQTAILFEDKFPAQVGVRYYFRVTGVDLDGDESRLSYERSITIQNFRIESFSPIQARVGQTVTIMGRYFSEYNEATDAVYFTGVRNTKGPSALQVSQVQAPILTWEDNRIRVSVPIGSTVGLITVQSNNTQQQTSGDFQCLSPYILSFDPDPVNAGSALDFYGANFGTPDATNLLLVDDVAYGGVFRQWADDHVQATVPTEIETGLHKFEMLIDGEVTNHCWIDVISTTIPYISSITPNYVVRDSETEITVRGSGFGDAASSVDVVINGATVTSMDFNSFSNTEVRFDLPADITLVGEAYVIRHSSIDIYSNSYIYHALAGSQESSPEGVAAGFNMGEYSDTARDFVSGATYVIYSDNTENNDEAVLFLAYWDAENSEWVSEVLTSAWGSEMRWPRIAVDTSGIVHFAYQRNGWMSEVRYGTWEPGVGVISDEQVYQAGSFDTPGDYLDMVIHEDGFGGIDRLLAWSMNSSSVQFGYKMAADSSWTVQTVYSADTAYSEEVGFYCSLDYYEELLPPAPPPASPPRGPSAFSGFYVIGISYGLYSPDYTPNYELRYSYTTDLTSAWYYDFVDSSTDPIKETVTRFGPGSGIPFIAWCTDNAVMWAGDTEGWDTATITSGDGPYGAALELMVDPLDNQYVVGHNREYEFFFATYGDPDYTWNVDLFENDLYREPTHVGRGGAMFFVDPYGAVVGAHMTLYDADMRDIAFIDAAYDMGSWDATWEDIADGFATPGHLLSNQAVVIGEDGRPCVVFSDIDPQSGTRTLWFAHFTGTIPVGGFSHLPRCQWEYFTLDSVFSGTLGRATMAMDVNGDYHIAYQRNSELAYLLGNPTDGFSSPVVLETFTAIPTAGPQIALGTDSTQDVFVATQRPAAESELVLLSSDDNMATHSLDVLFGTSNTISQYDVATRYDNGQPVMAAFLEGGANAVFVYDVSEGAARGFPATAGMNRGLTLTLDDNQHYCVTVADISGTGGGYLLEWDSDAEDYALNQFTTDANESVTMSQCRVEYGPVMTFVNGSYSTDYRAFAWVSMIDDLDRSNFQITDYWDDADISVYHALDAYEPYLNVYALYATIPELSNLYVGTYFEWE